jgi:hypothetical protein
MKYLVFIFILFQSFTAVSQSENIFFLEAGAAMAYGSPLTLFFNTSIGKRSVVQNTEQNNSNWDLIFYEVDQFATVSLKSDIKASLGYKYRFAEVFDPATPYEHRITEMISWNHTKTSVRLASRLRFEQRFFNDNNFFHRYRYRFSADFPFSGSSLDIREFYLVLYNEVLFEASEIITNTLENRVNVSFGYLISPTSKIQLSIEQRFEDLNVNSSQRTFIATNVFFSL